MLPHYTTHRRASPRDGADYQLLIPKEELQKTIAAEIRSFEEEQAAHTKDIEL